MANGHFNEEHAAHAVHDEPEEHRRLADYENVDPLEATRAFAPEEIHDEDAGQQAEPVAEAAEGPDEPIEAQQNIGTSSTLTRGLKIK